MRYYIKTFGCQMNFHDSEIMAGFLEKMHYSPAEDMNAADLIIINGCTVRKSADDKVWGLLQRMKGHDFAQKKVWIMGCFANAYAKDVMQSFPFVEKIISPGELAELDKVVKEKKKVWIEDRGIPRLEYFSSAKQFSPYSAYVTIMKGCDNFCSYCIVPFVRGRESSRAPEDIVEEIKVIADKGITEIILLGQNVNSYGRGLDKNIDFSDLLGIISEVEGIKRIRFVTSHPKDISDKLIDVMAHNPKICKYLHFPLQSGADNVLKRMNRGYTYEDYLEKVNKLRRAMPDIELSSDFIVGFPGETEDDFKKTLRAITEIKFVNAFLFKYSPRPGTAAARLKDDVPLEEKQRRLEILIQAQKEVSAEVLKKYKNSVQEVLCDEYKEKRGQYSGRTDTNIVVNFKDKKNRLGQYVKVKITRTHTYSLSGEVVE